MKTVNEFMFEFLVTINIQISEMSIFKIYDWVTTFQGELDFKYPYNIFNDLLEEETSSI